MGQNRLYEGEHNWKHLGRNQDTNGEIMMTGKTKYGQGNTRQRETDCDSYAGNSVNVDLPLFTVNYKLFFHFQKLYTIVKLHNVQYNFSLYSK